MAEHWAFLNRLRQDLGKSYTVAAEHTLDPLHVNILVRRRKHAETLVIETDTRWLTALQQEQPAALWSEYRQLVSNIGSFFLHPEALPSPSFSWPGTAQSRQELRQTLGRRRTRSA